MGYSARRDELLAVECKSYLDLKGVISSAFSGTNAKAAKRYKLFTENVTREVVLNRLRLQLIEAGAIPNSTQVKLCLVCGRISSDADRK